MTHFADAQLIRKKALFFQNETHQERKGGVAALFIPSIGGPGALRGHTESLYLVRFF